MKEALEARDMSDQERAAWLADKIVALGDYAKEAAEMLLRWPEALRGAGGVQAGPVGAPIAPSPASGEEVTRAEPTSEFCWLVELFQPGGNSMGYYHTGFTDLTGNSRTTKDPHQARRYSKADAEAVAGRLFHLAGVWRAIEHGFALSARADTEVTASVSGELSPQAIWRAIGDEAECVVQGGKKYLLLSEEMCVRLGGALGM